MTSGIRITGGSLRGRHLKVPPGIRPTSGRVRESLMDIWMPRLPGARVLDLFAGSGAVGIEAVSRGAAAVCLVEKHPTVLQRLAENCLLVDEGEACTLCLELPAGLSARPCAVEGEFDLIFADPPYAFEDFEGLVEAAGAFLSTSGELVIEHDSRRALPERAGGLVLAECRRYGDSSLSCYRPQ